MFYTAKVKRKFLTQRRGGAKYAERNKNLGTDPVRPLIFRPIGGSVPKILFRILGTFGKIAQNCFQNLEPSGDER